VDANVRFRYDFFLSLTNTTVSNRSPRYRVLSLCTLAFFATMVARLVISPVVPAITEAYGVASGDIGFALTCLWLAYACAQFPSGLLGDRYGERDIVLVAIAGTALGSGLLVVAPTFETFVLAVTLLGALAGLHYSVATTLLTRLSPNTGLAIGVHSTGAPIAGLLAPVAAAYVGASYGWRYAVGLGTIVAVPSLLLVWIGIPAQEPRRPEQSLTERLEFSSLFELLSRPAIRFTTVLSVCCAFVWQGTASFLPTFLIEFQGYTETQAGLVFSAYFVIQGIGQPVIGTVSDRLGRDVTAMGCMLAGVFGYPLFVVADSSLGIGAAVVCVGIAMSWGAALLPKFMDELATDEQGAGFGLVRTTYMILGSLGSVGVGVLAERFDWALTFLVLAGLLGFVFLSLLGATVRQAGVRSTRSSPE
jgi:predicted MFS family arabinose efflux permease